MAEQPQKPNAVVPENLQEMSPVEAWNAALDAIEPVVHYNNFWNDGVETEGDFIRLRIKKAKEKNA